MKSKKSIFGAFIAATALTVAVPMSATPVQAKPALTNVSDVKTSGSTRAAAEGITDISARRYYRRYGYGGGYYRPRYYRPYGYARPYGYGYGYGYARPYGYGGYGGYGGYRRPGIYLGF